MKILATVIITAVTILLYWQGIHYDYVQWDEGTYIVYNPHIQSLTLDNLYWMLTATRSAVWAPMLWLSYAIDYQISGIEPFAYHLTNILFHAVNSVWVFFLTILLLQLSPSAFVPKQQWLAGFIAALLFAVHPQHVEPVMWIASRKDVLSLFFAFATVWFYLHYTQSHKISHYGFAVVLYACAAATKPVVMTLPVVLILLDGLLLQRLSSIKLGLQRIVIEKLPFWGLALFSAGMAFYAHWQDQRIISVTEISWNFRILNAADMVTFYLSKWLIPFGFAPYYPFPTSVSMYSLLVVMAISGILLYFALKRQHIILGLVWLTYLVSLFPMLNIVTFNPDIAGADKFAYLPTIGFYMLFGIGVVKISVYLSQQQQFLFKVVIFALIFGLIQLSQQQMQIWKDSLHLWYAADLAHPNHPEIQDGLASAYFENHHYPAAIAYYQKNAALSPNCVRCDYGLANSYLKLDDKVQALHHFQQVIQHASEQSIQGLDDVYFKIALIYGQQGQINRALQAAQQGIILNPDNIQGQQLWQQLQQYAPK